MLGSQASGFFIPPQCAAILKMAFVSVDFVRFTLLGRHHRRQHHPKNISLFPALQKSNPILKTQKNKFSFYVAISI